jgi:hypothetical protein
MPFWAGNSSVRQSSPSERPGSVESTDECERQNPTGLLLLLGPPNARSRGAERPLRELVRGPS